MSTASGNIFLTTENLAFSLPLISVCAIYVRDRGGIRGSFGSSPSHERYPHVQDLLVVFSKTFLLLQL